MALQCGLRKEIERSSGRSPRVKVRDCPERGQFFAFFRLSVDLYRVRCHVVLILAKISNMGRKQNQACPPGVLLFS